MVTRIPLTRKEISGVVSVFYARVRAHDTLGPVFAKHVTDWPKHEEKIIDFWANAILQDGSYSGNPMRVHMQAGNVKSDHFPIWLRLFDETLAERLPVQYATQWSYLAHRIGRGLSLGIEEAQRPQGAVPNLMGPN